MSAEPTSSEGCRAMAAECGRRANDFARNRQFKEAWAQVERAKELCLLALKFELEAEADAKRRADAGLDITMTHTDIRT